MKQRGRLGASSSWSQRAPIARLALTAGAALALLATTACTKGMCVAGEREIDGVSVQTCACHPDGAAEATRRFAVIKGVALENDALSCNGTFGGNAICCENEDRSCSCTVVTDGVTFSCASTSSTQVSNCADRSPLPTCTDPPLNSCVTDADCTCDRRCIPATDTESVCTKACSTDEDCQRDDPETTYCAAFPASAPHQTFCQ